MTKLKRYLGGSLLAVGVLLAACGGKPTTVVVTAPPASTVSATPSAAPTAQPPTVIVQPPTVVTQPPVVITQAPAQNTGGSCGGGVSVNGSTSCAFALNVANAYWGNGGGSGTVYAYSPATSTTYSMYCAYGQPTVCTGGNNAVVYIVN